MTHMGPFVQISGNPFSKIFKNLKLENFGRITVLKYIKHNEFNFYSFILNVISHNGALAHFDKPFFLMIFKHLKLENFIRITVF